MTMKSLMEKRWVGALLAVLGSAQGLDSGVAWAGAAVIALTAAAIVIPAATLLLTSDLRLRFAAAAICGLLLLRRAGQRRRGEAEAESERDQPEGSGGHCGHLKSPWRM